MGNYKYLYKHRLLFKINGGIKMNEENYIKEKRKKKGILYRNKLRKNI